MKQISLTLLFVLSLAGAGWANTCAGYNGVYNTSTNYTFGDVSRHGSGAHDVYVTVNWTVTFSQGQQVNQYLYDCVDNANLIPTVTGYVDSGMVAPTQRGAYPAGHLITYATLAGGASGQGPLPVTAYEGNAAMERYPGDGYAYWQSAYYAGTVFTAVPSLSYSGSVLWNDPVQWSQTAPFVQASQGSPIMIPLVPGADCTKELTGVQDGINFNFDGTGYVRIAWLKQNAKCGFLAVRDEHDSIPTGHYLMGNLYPQPGPDQNKNCSISADKPGNGFCALWLLDQPQYHGDGDGWITAADGIWGKVGYDGEPLLGVWEDTCHCGILEFGKWHSLNELGVTALSTAFAWTILNDEHGNSFKMAGKINQWGKEVTVYDAWLQEKPAAR